MFVSCRENHVESVRGNRVSRRDRRWFACNRASQLEILDARRNRYLTRREVESMGARNRIMSMPAPRSGKTSAIALA